MCVFSLASGSLRESGINNHNIALFLLFHSKFGLLQPEPRFMMDNQRDHHNPPPTTSLVAYYNFVFKHAILLAANQKGSFPPTSLSTYPLGQFPVVSCTGSCHIVNGCHEKETHAKQSVLWMKLANPPLGSCLLKTKWMAETLNIYWVLAMRRQR